MICYEILKKLLVYQLQVIEVLGLNLHPELTMDVTNTYSFITIDIHKSGKQFAQIRFELSEDSAKVYAIYCEDPSSEESIMNRITKENWPGWRSPSNVKLPYSNEVIESLQIADRIAALTVNCTLGDNYHPGNFSKVSVNSQRIELQQVNHMNAKSLDHKNNYSMRSLVFNIPFEPDTVNKKFEIYHVGNMTVEFRDNSSENNRECGKKVVEELDKLSG